MKRYLIKRLLLIIPTLLLISLVVFLMTNAVSQDPVISLLQSRGAIASMDEGIADKERYAEIYKELNLDKPDFYFSIVPAHYPKSLNSIIDPIEREIARKALKKNFFIPKFYWHGTNSRYHIWIRSILSGSFGTSLSNGLAVSHIISKAFVWTFFLTVFDLILSLGIGLPLGYYLTKNPKGKPQRMLSQISYFLYSIPRFWLATLLVVYFTTSDYGSWTNIFPSVGIDILPGASTVTQVFHNLPKLILPVICLSIMSISYLARIMRRGLLNEMKAPYILTAYSKGLNKSQVLKSHALPNSMLPIITILADAIPTSLAGSVVIEVIFNIPGIGRLMYDSTLIADWNVVFCLVLLLAFILTITYLLGDICYALLTPKIRY